MYCLWWFIFFFKQKTAYEMRISDWSSDVCSSDLAYSDAGWGLLTAPEEFGRQGLPHVIGFPVEEYRNAANQAFAMYPGLTQGAKIGRASCRERVCQYV